MPATIKIKNSSTASAVPTSSDLVQGELAVNVTDKRIFTENASGTVVELGTNPSILTLPDGSASAPTLTNDGDTNTGIFFPAADTVGITTGGTERARVDSSGNLGLGVTPSAWTTSPKYYATEYTGGNATWSTGTQFGITANAVQVGNSWTYKTSAAASLFIIGQGTYTWYNAASGTAGNTISLTQAMTLDASGNFMVGGTSANGRARFVAAASTDCIVNLETSTNNYASGLTLNALNSNGAIYNFINSKYGSTEMWYVGGNGADSTLVFKTGGTERVRIDSSGYFKCPGMWNLTGASAANLYSDSTGQVYRSTSALKYKQDIRDLESIDINSFRPVRYKSKCEGDDQTKDHFGIVADEVDEAGIKELVTYCGNGEVEGFQYERLTVVLLKAIQEQQAIITQLQADVASVRSELTALKG